MLGTESFNEYLLDKNIMFSNMYGVFDSAFMILNDGFIFTTSGKPDHFQMKDDTSIIKH